MMLQEQDLLRVVHHAWVGVGPGVLVGTHLHTLGVGVELQLEVVLDGMNTFDNFSFYGRVVGLFVGNGIVLFEMIPKW